MVLLQYIYLVDGFETFIRYIKDCFLLFFLGIYFTLLQSEKKFAEWWKVGYMIFSCVQHNSCVCQ